MSNGECPHTQEIGSMQADISAHRVKLATMQSKFDLLTVSQIKEEAEKNGLFKGLKIAAIIIGYTVIASLFIVAAHFMGVGEFIAAMLKI